MSPLVSVVIPNHNYAAYVADAVESVLRQCYENLEIIVVDNGSTDNSLEVLRTFGSRIRLVIQENRGQARARNRGIEESRGEWVAFCDADDAWLPGKITKQMALANRPEIGIVSCGYLLSDACLKPLSPVFPKYRGRVLNRFALGVDAVFPGGESCVLIRKKCFDEIGGFDSELSISSGFDMYRRIAQAYEADFVPEPLMLYRQHQRNESKRIAQFDRDIFLAVEKMFRDPKASEISSLRRQCYGCTHLSLSGAYLKEFEFGKSLEHLVKGLVYQPSMLGYALAFPMRAVARVRA